MEALHTHIRLNRIHCYDEGDGPGSAEPYLWTVFFKIDGDTASVTPALSLQGTATVVGTPGNQGNLPNDDVDPGEDVPIPPQIGQFSTVLQPIPLQQPIGSIQNVGGAIGCVVVLMEEDNTPNSAIAKGHAALNKALQKNLNALVPTLNFTHQEPTPQDLAAIQAKVGAAVTSAIKDDVSVWEWLAGLGNMDDQIGTAVFHFSAQQLLDAGPGGIELRKRWKNEGDWEIFGRISASSGPSWSGWESLGGTLTAAPAVASWAKFRLDTFVRGTNNHLWHKWWNGNAWSGWEDLGGVLTSAPAAVSWGPNRIDVFGRGTDKAMWHRWWDGTQWHNWESLGGVLTSAPAVASWVANRLDCFVRGSDNRLWHRWWNGTQWSGWEDLGGELSSAPAAVSWGANRIDVFARGMDNAMWHKWWNGTAWSAWESLGGVLVGAPAVSSWAAGRLDCFVRGTNNHLWHKWWDGHAWSGWEDLGGVLTDAPAAVSWSENRIDVFVRGTDNAMWHKWWAGG